MNARIRVVLQAAILLVLVSLVLAACAPAQPAQPAQPSVDIAVIYTFAAMTNEAKQSAPLPSLPTATSVPTATEVPPTLAPPAACTDSAELVSEDPLDNAVFKPADKITKRWSLKNIGTCVWNGYRFEFDGKEMGGNASTPVNQVAPGQTIDLYAYVAAPLTAGTYKGGATLFNGAGGVVKVTYQGIQYDGVSIQIVVKGAATGAVTNVAVSIALEQSSSKACTNNSTYLVTLVITTDGPVSVSYTLYLTDTSGQVPDGVFFDSGSPQLRASLDFMSAETQTFTYRVTGPYSYPDGVTPRVTVNSQGWTGNTVVCN